MKEYQQITGVGNTPVRESCPLLDTSVKWPELKTLEAQLFITGRALRCNFLSVARLLPLLLLTGTASLQAQFNHTTNNGTITITKYTGSGRTVSNPDTTNGLPVTAIGDSAFYNCTSLTGVTIPGSVASIGDSAFSKCRSLTSVAIGSGVVSVGSSAFYN